MVEITVGDALLVVKSPFNQEFTNGAGKLGGKWNRTAREWRFDVRDEARVRQLCMDVYGTDGTPTATVTLHVDLAAAKPDDELIIGPIQVLKKWSRDNRPTLGKGCVIISGGLLNRGGSARYPRITYEDGTVIEVRDVPQVLAKKLAEEEPETYTIIAGGSDGNELTPEEKSLLATLRSLPTERLEMLLNQLQGGDSDN